jgi:signal transduction histidine kinase
MAIQMLEVTLEKDPDSKDEETLRPFQSTLDVHTADNRGRYLQILKDECQREISLVNDLLDLARLDAGTEALNPTTLDLQSWLARITQPYYERAIAQRQQFKIFLNEENMTLTTDPSYLERIVGELLNNACKYTPAEGLITVEVMRQRGLVMRVINMGVEISTNERDRIFDKFYRIPKNDPWKHGGTGLGLALVKKLVERIDATIEVESGKNQTIFTVRFS